MAPSFHQTKNALNVQASATTPRVWKVKATPQAPKQAAKDWVADEDEADTCTGSGSSCHGDDEVGWSCPPSPGSTTPPKHKEPEQIDGRKLLALIQDDTNGPDPARSAEGEKKVGRTPLGRSKLSTSAALFVPLAATMGLPKPVDATEPRNATDNPTAKGDTKGKHMDGRKLLAFIQGADDEPSGVKVHEPADYQAVKPGRSKLSTSAALFVPQNKTPTVPPQVAQQPAPTPCATYPAGQQWAYATSAQVHIMPVQAFAACAPAPQLQNPGQSIPAFAICQSGQAMKPPPLQFNNVQEMETPVATPEVSPLHWQAMKPPPLQLNNVQEMETPVATPEVTPRAMLSAPPSFGLPLESFLSLPPSAINPEQIGFMVPCGSNGFPGILTSTGSGVTTSSNSQQKQSWADLYDEDGNDFM